MTDITGTVISNMTDENILKKEILSLSRILDEKKHQLFLNRLVNMGIIKLLTNAKDFTITTVQDTQDWTVTYKHETNNYDPSRYLPDGEETTHSGTEADSDPISKVSDISFGKFGKRYFLKGGIKFNIYRNSAGELRVMNPEYDFDIDMEEHKQLIHRYSEDSNIPEACALSVFQFMIDNKWDDLAVINYLSIV